MCAAKMCIARLLRKHLLLINAVAVVLDVAFFGASVWVFSEIANVLSDTVAWYYLVASFAPPVCVPLYAALERLIRRDCIRKAARENAVAHAHGRAQHALAAAFWNSFGINTLTFWAPFFVDAVDQPDRLLPAVVWQRVLEIPSTLTFCVVYLITVAWNLMMQRVYLSIARDALRVLVEEEDAAEPVPSLAPKFVIEMEDVRQVGTRFYSTASTATAQSANLQTTK